MLLSAPALAQDWDALGGPGSGGPRKKAKARSDDIFNDMEGKVSLRFFDAVTGRPIAGARVAFEGLRTRTNAEGVATFPKPLDLNPMEDKRTALFSAKGYIRAKLELRFALGSLWANRYSISPALPPGKLRIVVDWAQKPGDLDAHLVKKGGYHISYQDMRKWQDRAQLDRDDRDGFGPETITINRLDQRADYAFFVFDYSHRKSPGFKRFAESRARVMVFGDGQLLHQFSAPGGAGLTWKVFEIRKGRLQVIDQMQ